MTKQFQKAQLDYIEAAAIAIAVGLAANRESVHADSLADTAYHLAEAMLVERENRYGEIERFL